MGIKFNPLIYAGFQTVTRSAGNSFFGNAVDTAGDLPAIGVDGELRVVKDTNSLYIYDAPTTSWKLVTDPLTDLRQITFTGSETTTATDVPGFTFAPSVESFDALVTVIKDGTQKEVIELTGTKTATTPQRTMDSTGDMTTIDFEVVEDSGALKVQYKTDAAAATYEITFRAITLT